MQPIKLLLILALLTCLSPARAEPVHLQVGIDLWPGYYPVILADKLGYFQQHDLTVSYRLPEDTDNMLDDFTSGKIDIVCVALGDVFALKSKLPGLKVLLISDESAGGDALLAKTRQPLLSRKTRIGTNLNGFGELFVSAFLESRGLSLADVTLVHQEASQALSFLEEDKADIVHTWEPYVSEITSYLGGKVVFSSRQTPGLIPDAVVFGDIHQNNPEATRNFISAWLQASQWWLEHRHEGDRIIEETLLLTPNSVDLEGLRLYTLNDNLRAFKPGNNRQSLYFVAEQYIHFFQQKGLLGPEASPEDYISGNFLPTSSARH